MKDNKKINKTRRNRGYVFEKSVVKKFQSLKNWDAVRLGSPSIDLPDVFGINDCTRMVCGLEAKSGVGNILYVPTDQIERCIRWVRMFGAYSKCVVLAFKFKGETGGRKLRYFYKIFPVNCVPVRMSCNYEGKMFRISDDKKRDEIELEDFKWE